MPYYEYLCDEGHEFEVEQRITDDPLPYCTVTYYECKMEEGNDRVTCGWGTDIVCNAPCRRQISQTSFTFKGGPPTPKTYQ